jgi:hypothetical protein
MNKELIKEQVQEILDKNYCTFQGGNEADIHSCYDIAELFEQLQNKWISVNDKLPLKDKSNDIECLCFDNYHNQVRVLVFNVYHNCWDDESGDDFYTDAIGSRVTHWMPLPNKPILTTED